MATWTQVKTSAIAGSLARHVASSGTKFYYVDNDTEDVYEYDPDTNTESLIIDASAITDYSETVAITWFNGNLYVMNWYTGPELRVERWNGTANSLTTVKTFAENFSHPNLISDDSIIVGHQTGNAEPFEAESWYSSNGSSWSAGSWDVSVYHPPDLNGPFDITRQTDYPTGLYQEFVTDTNIGLTLTTEKSIFKFIGGVWTKIAVLNTGPSEIYQYSSPNEGVHWTYTLGQYYDSGFAGTTTIPSSPLQIYQVNMPYSVAIDNDVAASIYEYSGGAWTALDAFPVGWDFNSVNRPAVVRMTDGDVFFIGYVNTGSGFDMIIAARSEPIEPGCTLAQFYYGIGVPVLKGDLPFCRVNPGGLAVSVAGVAVVGAALGSDEMVAYQAYPFEGTWNDMSGIVPTGTAVTSIKFI